MVHWSKNPEKRQETLDKISKGRKGKCLGNQYGFKKGQTAWNNGLPKEHQPRFGKQVSEKQIENMRKIGKKSFPTWNKNIIEWSPRTEDIQRSKALARDNFQCTICGDTIQLVVHHKKCYEDIEDKSKIHELDNLQTLCRSCHFKIHNKQKLEKR